MGWDKMLRVVMAELPLAILLVVAGCKPATIIETDQGDLEFSSDNMSRDEADKSATETCDEYGKDAVFVSDADISPDTKRFSYRCQ